LATLQSKILKQLDDIDCESPAENQTAATQRRKSSIFRTGRLLALAAAVVVIVGVGFYANQAVDEHAQYLPLERAHTECVSDLSPYRNAEETNALLASVSSDVSYELAPSVHGFQLVGGHLEVIDGVEMAHFVYTTDNRVISAFVVPADEFDVPEDLRETGVLHNGMTFLITTAGAVVWCIT
jgi:anti-sigma factor RsiW